MKIVKLPRIMLVGTGSSSGKTTATIALLSTLKERGAKVKAFKCGPDYIDPMFHSRVMGMDSRNIDLYLQGYDALEYVLAHGEGDDLAIIEGVMGMYDGIGFKDDRYSANHIARLTNTPELLVANVKGKGRSFLANIKGYIDFHENKLKGVIINNCSEAMYKTFKPLIESELSIPCYGYIPEIKAAAIGSRHLGLITAGEIEDLQDKIDILGETVSKTIDIEAILELAKEAGNLIYDDLSIPRVVDKETTIAVAKDKAFCFYYRDNLEILEKMGGKIVYFSPMEDKKLPANIQGIILGGGYPEEYLNQVMTNEEMKESIKTAAFRGVPIYAECGGFMYLGNSITRYGTTYQGVGVLPGNSFMTEKLTRFGYKTLTANKDNLMCKKGESIKCHEFHYSDTDDYGNAFQGRRESGLTMDTIHATDKIFAGYPHIHWLSNLAFPENFIKACAKTEPFND